MLTGLRPRLRFGTCEAVACHRQRRIEALALTLRVLAAYLVALEPLGPRGECGATEELLLR